MAEVTGKNKGFLFEAFKHDDLECFEKLLQMGYSLKEVDENKTTIFDIIMYGTRTETFDEKQKKVIKMVKCEDQKAEAFLRLMLQYGFSLVAAQAGAADGQLAKLRKAIIGAGKPFK